MLLANPKLNKQEVNNLLNNLYEEFEKDSSVRDFYQKLNAEMFSTFMKKMQSSLKEALPAMNEEISSLPLNVLLSSDKLNKVFDSTNERLLQHLMDEMDQWLKEKVGSATTENQKLCVKVLDFILRTIAPSAVKIALHKAHEDRHKIEEISSANALSMGKGQDWKNPILLTEYDKKLAEMVQIGGIQKHVELMRILPSMSDDKELENYIIQNRSEEHDQLLELLKKESRVEEIN